MAWFKRRKIYDEDYDDDEYDEDEEEVERETSVAIEGNLDLKVVTPKNFEQLLLAVDYLNAGSTVLLNLEGVEKELYKRMIDFMSGAAYALDAVIKKATQDSYFVAPKDVDVSGDIFDSSNNSGKGSDNEVFSNL
jgi:cell division inhibitor SepF